MYKALLVESRVWQCDDSSADLSIATVRTVSAITVVVNARVHSVFGTYSSGWPLCGTEWW